MMWCMDDMLWCSPGRLRRAAALGTLCATNRSNVQTRSGHASAVLSGSANAVFPGHDNTVLSDRANAVCPCHGSAVLSYSANTVFPDHDSAVLLGRADAVFPGHPTAMLSDRANAYVYVNVYADRKPLLANMAQQASYI